MRMLRACVLAAAAAIKFPAMRFPRAPRSRPRLTPTNYKSAASDLYKPNTVDPDAPLTRSQFQGALDRLGLKPTPKEMRNLWALLDSDGDGTCTVKEFSNFVSTKFDDAAPSVAGDLQDALKTKPSRSARGRKAAPSRRGVRLDAGGVFLRGRIAGRRRRVPPRPARPAGETRAGRGS